ncbi:PAS domain-containing sensor histidine kinase [Octadecabacter sp. 1_MG-2023]|uniref:sensor histidine kinase NtrY-like n=1 Tax=unclassified Octadecabacter TaxID=196158 RepID=UPI001C09122A|nr:MULTISPECIES: PAS domain-containing sensor histidine kinase [unclassified Octadecabacter]MBU2993308.1 PAS domain-containing sensor histidine kinase [Octadecabacter sp. B2R22]MDO6733236.1 PAS domain-containing sensor histidine kinase [Octadecabacter sp. 1_MG-2023]
MLAFSRWRRRRSVRNASTVVLVALAPVLVILTITALRPLDQTGRTDVLRLILLADIIYVLIIAALVASRVVSMIAARRNKSAGSRLHLRLTGVFGLLALIPTVAVAVFAVLTINIGLEGWFSERVRNVLGNSLSAAQAYEEEHRQEVARDGIALAGFLNTERLQTFFMQSGEVRQALARVQPQIERGLTEVFVLDAAGEIWVRGEQSYEFYFERPELEQLTEARQLGMLIIEDYSNNEFRALIPLEAFNEKYLYVTREVDGEILSLLDNTQETVLLYGQLEDERGRVLFEFGLIYLGFALILIIAAVWVGLWFAERLSRPIGRLVGASQRVGSGDLTVRVREEDGEDEIAQLGRYFNQMTEQLSTQREELLDNTRQIERRRRLFDSVLSSVPSGVVGLDEEGRVTFVNRSAGRLLEVDGGTQTALSVAVPEFAALFDEMTSEGKSVVQGQVNLVRGGKQESLLVRMSHRSREDDSLEGYVVAFEDVTDLVSAQRMAAWGDVARRIAHEIKNPLTPIQLSAERIKRKFSKEVEVPGDLEQLTDVIVRQTNDLRRIVDEFSKFARMPEPDRHVHDLANILRDAVTLQDAGQPDVTFSSDIPTGEVWADLDSTMMSQALTNLIKNAGEAIESLREKEPGFNIKPQVKIAMSLRNDVAEITIADNGIGLPEDRAKLFEPYVTTRDKGTGLGLPIVKKIIDEHGGTLTLTDAPAFDGATRFGAMAVITLPIQAAAVQPIKETA